MSAKKSVSAAADRDDVPDTQDMFIIHRMFRQEVALLGPMIASVAPGDASRSRKVGDHADLIIAFLSNHHRGEDELLWPLLQTRSPAARGQVDVVEAQHHGMATSIERIEAALPVWSATASPAEQAVLVEAFGALHVALVEHLGTDEQHVLPLVPQYLSTAEWGRLAEHGQAATPRQPQRALMLLGAILADADPEQQTAFLSTVPLPGRLAWRLIGRRRWAAYIADLRASLTCG